MSRGMGGEGVGGAPGAGVPELTYGHQLDVFPLQELQRQGHILQLHLAESGPLVVLSQHALLAQHLQQGDESQSVAQVQLQVRYPLVDTLEVLVAPAGESVLLDLLPRSVVRQVFLRDRHLVASLGTDV